MGQQYDQASDSSTGIAAGGTLGATELKTGGQSDSMTVFVDDNAGGTPASHSLEVEVYDEVLDEWLTLESTTAGTSPSQSFDAVGGRMRVTLTNESGAAADFRMVLHSYK